MTVRGREHLVRGRTYVMVANHLSLLDILVLFRLFRHFTWVSKAENFRVPFVGWNMRLNAYIPLRRGDKESVAAMLATAEADLREGIPLMIFPEGTRSRDGALRPFKDGAFDLALRTGVPVLPIVVRGTGDALPRRGFVLRGRHPISRHRAASGRAQRDRRRRAARPRPGPDRHGAAQRRGRVVLLRCAASGRDRLRA